MTSAARSNEIRSATFISNLLLRVFNKDDDFDKILNYIDFVCWIRYPFDENNFRVARSLYLLKLSDYHQKFDLNQQNERKNLNYFKNIEFAFLSDLIQGNVIGYDMDFNAEYSNVEYMRKSSEIAKFLLFYKPLVSDKGNTPILSGAYL